MTAPELEPCPFCGPMNGHYGFTVGRFGTRLTCFCCDSHGPRAETREEAISSWNRRADLPPTLEQAKALPEIKALVEALRECADDLEAFTRAEYGWPNVHPAMHGKIDRDMQVVVNARAALRAIGEGGE